jgi:hypothetical protein
MNPASAVPLSVAESQQNPSPTRRCRSAPPFHLQQNLFDFSRSQCSALLHVVFQINLPCRSSLFTQPSQDKAEIYPGSTTLDMEAIYVYSGHATRRRLPCNVCRRRRCGGRCLLGRRSGRRPCSLTVRRALPFKYQCGLHLLPPRQSTWRALPLQQRIY